MRALVAELKRKQCAVTARPRTANRGPRQVHADARPDEAHHDEAHHDEAHHDEAHHDEAHHDEAQTREA